MTIALAEGLARKLALKTGMRLRLIEPPAGYEAALVAAVGGLVTVELAPGPGPTEATLALATAMGDLRRVAPLAIASVVEGGPLWIAYPKGGSGVATDLKRDLVWPVLVELGWKPIQQIAVDPVWTALRFRPLG